MRSARPGGSARTCTSRKSSRSLRVLYFGTYERDYPRNAQVMSALRGAGVEVVERHAPVWEGSRDNWATRRGAALRLMLAEARLWWPPRGEYDVVLVGYPGHFDMPRARRVAGKRPLVFNPLVSLHDTMVGDRARYSERSFAARALKAVDRRALRLADLVVADTHANADFLAEIGEIARSKVEVCFVGAEDRLFHAGWRPDDPFRALFVGKLIPLHGVEVILEAARLAPEIPFRVIGSGQLEQLLGARPENVEWIPWVNYEDLPRELWGAGCALGIFAPSPKTMRVIPNKAYQALACGTPLITGDTPAARELLADERDAILVPPGDPAALAQAVRRLAGDPDLARRLGAGGRRTYEEQASEAILGARWRKLLEQQLR
jgi:glycosyltransferase involved in cell wall biosynthesis